MANRIDSNATGLRYAEETTTGVLPETPVWYPLDPNSYNDFGGQLQTMARYPINTSRQRKKGTVTDLEASGGFNQDLTQNNLTRLLQGILFADIREKKTTAPMNTAATTITAVTTTEFQAASGLGTFLVNHIVKSSGFAAAANNSIWKLSAVAAGAITTSGLTAEASPPAAAKVEVCGYEFASATVDITVNTGLPRLARVSGSFDFTTLNLVPGEWVYLGSDTAGERFTNNRGFARVNAVAATYIEFDKTDWTAQAEVGTGLTIRLYYGHVLKNETTAVRKTYQIERTLGEDANGTMSEYLVGASPNEFQLNVKQADKITFDVKFVATDNEQRNGTTEVKAGTRPTLVTENAFNTSSDFSRTKLASVSAVNSAPTALFAYFTDLSIGIKNNVSALKAVGVLGAFDTTAGSFDVDGKLTAYFASIDAVQAVRNNADVTLDIVIARDNAGIAIDLPLISLGDGRLNVEKDQSIQLPLDLNAAESKFGHTVLFSFFSYLPTAAY